ncbi:MAG: hypothetical protein DCC68_20145 [Planctomycetota bacterium]|nr:MAG: hypothetical protein DCC68_20145 [Planctomycetota bacterium]
MEVGLGETLLSNEHGFTYRSTRSGQTIEVVDVGEHDLRICGQTHDLRDGWLLGCKVRDGTCEVFRIEESFGREIPVAVYENDQIEAYLCDHLEAIARTDERLRGMRIDPRAAAKGPESE